MDELELLKKDWKNQDEKYPKLTKDEIYKMILKKSSSIVKWIFIISLLEFVFWFIISFALKDTESMKRFNEYDADFIVITISIIGYVILAYFFYLFYRNYKKISVTDSAKVLMENILKTRKTVKQYVIFNLGYLILTTFIFSFIMFNQDQEIASKISAASQNGEALKFYAITILAIVIMLVIAVGVLLLFYFLIYGLLLKRLNRNYKELKKMELKN